MYSYQTQINLLYLTDSGNWASAYAGDATTNSYNDFGAPFNDSAVNPVERSLNTDFSDTSTFKSDLNTAGKIIFLKYKIRIEKSLDGDVIGYIPDNLVTKYALYNVNYANLNLTDTNSGSSHSVQSQWQSHINEDTPYSITISISPQSNKIASSTDSNSILDYKSLWNNVYLTSIDPKVRVDDIADIEYYEVPFFDGTSHYYIAKYTEDAPFPPDVTVTTTNKSITYTPKFKFAPTFSGNNLNNMVITYTIPNVSIKDFYSILASKHSGIPQTSLFTFDFEFGFKQDNGTGYENLPLYSHSTFTLHTQNQELNLSINSQSGSKIYSGKGVNVSISVTNPAGQNGTNT